jgi:hypothetical protein
LSLETAEGQGGLTGIGVSSRLHHNAKQTEDRPHLAKPHLHYGPQQPFHTYQYAINPAGMRPYAAARFK